MSTYDSLLSTLMSHPSSYGLDSPGWRAISEYKTRTRKLGEWQKLPVPEIDDADSPEIHFGNKDFKKSYRFRKTCYSFHVKNVDKWTNWYGKGRCPCHHGDPGHCNRYPDTEVSGFVQADRIVNGKIMFRFTWQIKLEKIGFTISQPLVEKLEPVAIPTHDRYKFYTRPIVPKED